MNKKEFIDVLASKTEMSKADTSKFVDSFLSTIEETLKKGDNVKFIGFGSFEVRDQKARVSRNPRTGEPINVPARKSPAFKAGAALKEALK